MKRPINVENMTIKEMQKAYTERMRELWRTVVEDELQKERNNRNEYGNDKEKFRNGRRD